MADILASVSVVIGAEISGFRAAMASARRELSGLVKFSEGLKDIGQSLTQYVTVPLALLGAAAVTASGRVEALSKGLQAVTLNELGQQGVTGLQGLSQAAQLTQDRLKELEQIAKQPGLGFEGAVQGDVRLRSVGISAEQSAKSIKAFANAIATTGGGKNEFDRVTVQLAQLSAKGKVLAQDLRPIIEAAPAVAAALQKLYGTVDSETISASLKKQGLSSKDFIGILTDELGKLPQVEGGLKNAFENLADTALLGLAKIGDGISRSLDVPGIVAKLSSVFTGLADGFAGLPPAAQTAIVSLVGLAAATGPVLVVLGSLGVALPAVRAGILEVRAASLLLQNNMATLRAGVAAVLSPTGAFIAVAATLAGIIYAISTESRRALESFQEQAQATKELTSTVTPLLARYDELKSKTSLTVAEQEELRAVMQKIAEVVPDATRQLDENGKVSEINAAKVRELVKAQQELVRAKAVKALPGQEKELAQAEALNQTLKKRLDYYNQTGKFQENVGLGLKRDFLPSQDGLNDFRLYLAQSNVDLAKQRQLVEELTATIGPLDDSLRDVAGQGGDLATALGRVEPAIGLLAGLHEKLKQLKQDQQDAPTERLALSYNPLIDNLEKYIARLEGSNKATKKAADAIAALRKELRDAATINQILPPPGPLDIFEEKIKILEGGLKKLVEAGVAPSSRAFQGFVQQLVDTHREMDNLLASPLLERKALDLDLKVTFGQANPQAVLGGISKELADHPLGVPFTLKPIRTDFSSALLKTTQGLQDGFANASANAIAFGDSFDYAAARVAVLQQNLQALVASGMPATSKAVQDVSAQLQNETNLLNINQAATSALTSGLADLANGFLVGLGGLASGTSSLEAFGATMLGLVGKLATQLGQAIIAVGIGMLNLKTAFTNPFSAIAAGAALVVVGAALGAISSSLSSVGSGGGASVSTSPASSPRSYAPSTAPAGGSYTGPTTTVHKIEVHLANNALVGALDLEFNRLGRVVGTR